MTNTAWNIAVVGAGPVGLALALHASKLLPHAGITIFAAGGPERGVSPDPRPQPWSMGSVQFLRRLGAWPAAAPQTPPRSAGVGGLVSAGEGRLHRRLQSVAVGVGGEFPHDGDQREHEAQDDEPGPDVVEHAGVGREGDAR